MLRSRFRAAAVAVATALFVSSCGLGPAAGGSGGDTLTIYASRPKNIAQGVVDRFEQAYPQYRGKVRMLTMGAAEVAERVRAEKARPQGDVWWGGTSQQFDQGVAADLLTPLPAPVVDRVPAQYRGAGNKWLAEMRMVEVIFYNRSMLDPGAAPKDWNDLVAPAWKKKILVRDVAASGTMRGVYAALISRGAAATGSPEAGYSFLRGLDANTKDYAPNPSDLYLRIQRQEAPVSIWDLQDVLVQQKHGAPFAPVMPASGAPVQLDGVGKIKGGPNGAAADAFASFLLQQDTQQRLADESFQLPTVPLAKQPTWLSALGGLREMKVDWQSVSAHEQQWIDYWSQNIKGRG